VKKIAPKNALAPKSDPEVVEARRAEHEYRVVNNERESVSLSALPMIGLLGHALGVAPQGDLIDSMLEEAAGAVVLLRDLTKADPSVCTDKAYDEQCHRIERTIEVARELYRRRTLTLDGAGLAIDAAAEE
jgi:hypothetical protein